MMRLKKATIYILQVYLYTIKIYKTYKIFRFSSTENVDITELELERIKPCMFTEL